ncbi:hemerythrin family protein [Thermosphaera chiliense]|uniref:Hemerythrin family protein n=1 Tax=Thermosphaera chiliense TaxID=3402707 RepID=A0A7M1US16_9CREN|nr:hemerythrin family protein [Thermosphaera aggregans]QOR93812.1 hemerythrin family protein [Thermosphaera aggregans]
MIPEAGATDSLSNDCGVSFSPMLRDASQKISLSRLRDLLELERLEHLGQTLRDLAREVSKAREEDYLLLDYRNEKGVNCLILAKASTIVNVECLGVEKNADKYVELLAHACIEGRGELRVYRVKPIFIEWLKKYEVGIPVLDKAHEKMFTEFQKVFTAILDGRVDQVPGLIKAAYESILEHFRVEEQLMTKYNYPRAKRREHEESHAEFENIVKRLVQTVDEGRFVDLYIQQYQFLLTYLDYMLREDKEFTSFLLEKCGVYCTV